MINSIRESFDVFSQPFTKYSLVANSASELYLNQSVVNKLKSNPDIERLIACDTDGISTNFSIGGSAVIGTFASSSDLKYFLSKMSNTVKEGRLPKDNTNEIAVHQRVMSNKNWKIGQIVGNKVDSKEYLTGFFKIVGVLDGPTVTFVGTQSNREKQYVENGLDTTKSIEYEVFAKPGKFDAVNKILERINENDAAVTDYNIMVTQENDGFASINATLIGVVLVVTAILSISISSLMYLIYLQRSDEFGILLAMGYRKSFIYRLILKEILFLNIISWATGFLLAYFLIYLLNYFVYNPQGSVLNFFSYNVFENTLCIPIVATLFSILPILSKMRKQDPITIIERRD
jgi:putative ABC transport system permease protein